MRLMRCRFGGIAIFMTTIPKPQCCVEILWEWMEVPKVCQQRGVLNWTIGGERTAELSSHHGVIDFWWWNRIRISMQVQGLFYNASVAFLECAPSQLGCSNNH
jgi:hypothetical protein